MTTEQKIDKLMDLYHEIKEEIRKEEKHFFERWKAGGFLIDPDIVSMYPILADFES
jgi:hypothetical protein